MIDEEIDQSWGGLSVIDDDKVGTEDDRRNVTEDNADLDVWNLGNPDDIVAEEDLPFTRVKLSLDEEEEEIDAVRTMQAWVVDIPDPKYIATMLKWLKQSGLDSASLVHLKRIRRQGNFATLLIGTSPTPPPLPDVVGLSAPYQISVPCTPALTLTSLELKNTFWPTVYAPRRKWEPENWTKGKVRWAHSAMKLVQESAKSTSKGDDLPIVARVPQPYEDPGSLSQPFVANDSRISTRHPLRHAVLNVIRQVADYRALQPSESASNDNSPMPILTGDTSSSEDEQIPTDVPRNGAHYLLTGQTLFTTHEPCVMCSMALLHSRVKEVFYLVPMPLTGGCGGLTCLPALKPVNHRFTIAQWKAGKGDLSPITLDENTDA
ncbi:hypothetical protein BV22DRAFT_1018099 [Leucogyrophana mollusca]|uniref:Uncharacterized protein n=1 Tax=Leucogyrophana mollusca TaxID=85980 RepID=A0ACB8B9R0_9AGAM|nr:hypothetical protein BV22DRAFT_1018099 [Leucogyrophana mollusca]